ncbi:glycosyltransferase family 50 protein [[Candida] arabinofermentans NRRL YB-2248]|uniref:GPI mannosyltransferase 1 n=1 Tax=[Candida] arabinofermentans NRRL YB-2248 TaxID=983967 RepID=A0A1E4T4M0_9ASCO|nr:glycosyltransferase family 50 protein [[Candida] arabinofermentans NRRL YB-2248]
MPLIVQTINDFKIPRMSTKFLLATSLIARIAFLIFGIYQDKYMKLPYTDIDYFVFTDASRFVFQNESPYLRDTYRYTPLLAWLLLPCNYWFEFGYLIIKILQFNKKNTNLSLLWLWNPMVITISTRGSSESIMTIVVLLITYHAMHNNIIISGLLSGLAIHLKIYPVIYIPAILLTINSTQSFKQPITLDRLLFIISTVVSFGALTALMYYYYGWEYLNEAYLYHLIRLDHRHNFSIYNIALYFNSYTEKSSLKFFGDFLKLEKLAFIPQLSLSAVLIPLTLANINLPSCLFIQTFTFITFNKVITSQYFIWFLCFLPMYLSTTTISLKKGVILIIGWVLTQALWLYYGYKLEFLGEIGIFTFGIWSSSCIFFIWNCYMIGEFITDVREQGHTNVEVQGVTD